MLNPTTGRMERRGEERRGEEKAKSIYLRIPPVNHRAVIYLSACMAFFKQLWHLCFQLFSWKPNITWHATDFLSFRQEVEPDILMLQ